MVTEETTLCPRCGKASVLLDRDAIGPLHMCPACGWWSRTHTPEPPPPQTQAAPEVLPAVVEPIGQPFLPLERTILGQVYAKDDYARGWQRLWANIIDTALLAYILYEVAALVRGIQTVAGEDFTAGEEITALAGMAIPALYRIGLKSAYGTTFGYIAAGIRLVSQDGKPTTINQVAVREFSSLFSLLVLGLGYFAIRRDARKQGWHDKVAGTYVVRDDARPIGQERLRRRRAIRVKLFATQMGLSALAYLGLVVAFLVFLHVPEPSENTVQTVEDYYLASTRSTYFGERTRSFYAVEVQAHYTPGNVIGFWIDTKSALGQLRTIDRGGWDADHFVRFNGDQVYRLEMETTHVLSKAREVIWLVESSHEKRIVIIGHYVSADGFARCILAPEFLGQIPRNMREAWS